MMTAHIKIKIVYVEIQVEVAYVIMVPINQGFIVVVIRYKLFYDYLYRKMFFIPLISFCSTIRTNFYMF